MDNISTTNNKLTPSTTENVSAKNNISFDKQNSGVEQTLVRGNSCGNFNIAAT